MAATKTTTLLDLAQNFDKYMFGHGIKPISKGFTVDGGNELYWEILKVNQNGTYPCVASTIRRFDQNSTVIIHHIDNK